MKSELDFFKGQMRNAMQEMDDCAILDMPNYRVTKMVYDGLVKLGFSKQLAQDVAGGASISVHPIMMVDMQFVQDMVDSLVRTVARIHTQMKEDYEDPDLMLKLMARELRLELMV